MFVSEWLGFGVDETKSRTLMSLSVRHSPQEVQDCCVR